MKIINIYPEICVLEVASIILHNIRTEKKGKFRKSFEGVLAEILLLQLFI